MKFNGIEKDYITVLRGRVRPPWADEEGKRQVIVPVKIQHEGFTDLQRKKEDVASWLIHEDDKALEFVDEPDRIYLAKVENEMSVEGFHYWAEGEIEFLCKEKYSLERTIIINQTGNEIVKGHKSTPWKTKTTFTEKQTGYELQFNSPGETDLRDINKIILNYNFIAGDILEIDYSKRKVTVNGDDITNAVSILKSNFMELPIGEVEFEVSHETEFYYSERFY